MNRQIFQKAADLLLWAIFPPCCPACGRSMSRDECFCPGCMDSYYPADADCREGKQLPPETNLFAAAYYEGSMREAIHRMKFSGHPGSAATLAPLLLQALRESGAAEGRFDLLVPVPSRPKKVRARGYNQSALLAHELSKRTGIPVSETALVKTRDTRAQHDLSAEERQVNLSGSFRASESEVSGRRILLIDDVLTTGATARECIGALRAAGAQSADLLVLAVTNRDGGHDGTGDSV